MTNEDRDQVVEHVKAAYAEGRLDKDEMDERLHLAMTAQTHADLMPIMTDLYGTRPAYVPRPPVRPAPAYAYAPGVPGVPDGGDRVAGAAAHLLTLAGLFVVGPLLIMATAGRTSPYIRRHAVESLNFHLTVLGGSILLLVTVVGAILLPVIWVLGIVLSIVGGVTALTGTDFRYPLTLRLVK
ncbi:DUF1707 and DUF4870 domain-containing protein [Microbispora sp. ATCC PTA-5024]|uniref:DUF1707 and DUF4870 domain-containing protein n=1 Tax=Microbispora sp. ATCC PTA-5024 TaxID=316330 RepID=UPI0003DCD1DE|nr:DUF1707 and DUF4870 domain-containing protein [Microbispora sp. ATCC PTA-5024]ETK32124.1 hypothetical protein MPTA5024_31470 [Microbispora sp. ATCC PTA-5024]